MTSFGPPLLGIFKRLRAEGMVLSVKDFLDGLRALEHLSKPFESLQSLNAGAGYSSTERVRDREELVWLCQTLWARSPEEHVLIRRVISTEVGLADVTLALRLHDIVEAAEHDDLPPFEETPPPPPSGDDAKKSGERDKEKTDGDGSGDQDDDPDDDSAPDDSEDQTIGADLDEGGENPLPSVRDLSIPGVNRFSMRPEQLMSPLWMASLWRRMFKPRKTYDRTRIDATATVREAARVGVITEPKYAVRHVNTARLLVLLDVGAHMEPWFDFQDLMRRSLTHGSSRLKQVGVAHFVGAPGRRLFREKTLRGAVALPKLLKTFQGCPVLILGEAGAIAPARRDLGKRLQAFFDAIRDANIKPTVWINPMPPERWQRDFTDLTEHHAHTHSLPLNPEAFLRAVDLLRGVVS